MIPADARRILDDAKYWHYRFAFPWGETTPTKPGWGERVQKRRRHFFLPLLAHFGGSLKGKTVLDLGCCQGYWSFEARRAGADRVTGVDSCPQFVVEARAAAVALGVDCCSFMNGHLEEEDWDLISTADITLFLGTLYHLVDPIYALRKAMEITNQTMLIDGEVIASPDPILKLVPRNPDEPTTVRSMAKTAYRTIPSIAAIMAILRDGGFSKIKVLEPVDMPKDYHDGTTASILASR